MPEAMPSHCGMGRERRVWVRSSKSEWQSLPGSCPALWFETSQSTTSLDLIFLLCIPDSLARVSPLPSPRSGVLASNRLTPKFPEQELPIHLYIEQHVQRSALVLPVFQGHGGWRRCGMCAQRVMQERLQLTVTEMKGHPPTPRQRFPRSGIIRDTKWNKSNRLFYLDISKSHSSWALRIS